MPTAIARLLDSSIIAFLARVVLCLPFWASGLNKVINFSDTVAEMSFFGLEPAGVFAVAVIVTQLLGSLLVIVNRATWLGAGALGIFTLLTIPIVHHFWDIEGMEGQIHFYFAMEHLGLVGGLILVAILSRRI